MLIFLLFFICSKLTFGQNILQGKVIRVADGDTFTLIHNKVSHKIRLHGIDCPEKGQEFSQVAKEFTKERTLQKNVKVEVLKKDQYGRNVGIVWLEDGSNLNLQLLNEGLAWHYTKFDKSDAFRNAENQAKHYKKKIWSVQNPLAPWTYRQQRKIERKQKQTNLVFFHKQVFHHHENIPFLGKDSLVYQIQLA